LITSGLVDNAAAIPQASRDEELANQPFTNNFFSKDAIAALGRKDV
jgi:hypothetical protein